MRSRVLAVAATLLVTTACLETLEPPNGRLGVIIMDTYESGGDFVLKPIATFYDQTNAGFATAPTDTCFVASFSVGSGISNVKTMEVGSAISLVFPDKTEPLTPLTTADYTYYRTELATGIVFTPGDSVEAQIPGNGGSYPPVNLKVRTAEEFTHAVVPVPEEGVNIDLTWDPTAEPGSIMSFSLRYVTSTSQTGLYNQQVFCALGDDGAHTIQAGLLDGWRTSQNDLREVKATRLRFAELQVDTRSKVAIVSTFSRPIPTPP